MREGGWREGGRGVVGKVGGRLGGRLGEEVEGRAGRQGGVGSVVAHRSACCSREISGYELRSTDLFKRVSGPLDGISACIYGFQKHRQWGKHRWELKGCSCETFLFLPVHISTMHT